jgi:hypothetical protein
MGLLDTKAQEALLVYEVAQLGPFEPKDLKLYHLLESFDWKYLPDEGGLRQQNAGLMERLMNIRLAYRIADDLFELQEKAEEQFDKLQGFSEDADQFNVRQKAIDERRNG